MRELPEAEYMKIRNYILNLVFHAGRESVLIPSSRELAVQFQVARGTATKALDLLIDEGFLIPRKGVGTFSNPRSCNSGARFRLVGLLIGGGKNLFHGYSGWVFPALVGLELTKNNCFVREIRLTGIDAPERIEREVRSEMFDGLLCCGGRLQVQPLLEHLAAEDFPVISVYNEGNMRSYDLAYRDSGREIAELLLHEGRRKIAGLFLGGHQELMAGIREVCEKNDAEFFPFSSVEQAERFIAGGNAPDSFYITGAFDQALIDCMLGVRADYFEHCRLVTFSPKVTDPRFTGYQHRPPENECAGMIARDLLLMMDGVKLKREPQSIRLRIEKINF